VRPRPCTSAHTTTHIFGGRCKQAWNRTTLFAWLISHQPAVLFSQNKPATNNQPAVLFSQNKTAPVINHQPNEAVSGSEAHVTASRAHATGGGPILLRGVWSPDQAPVRGITGAACVDMLASWRARKLVPLRARGVPNNSDRSRDIRFRSSRDLWRGFQISN
jgi:hypothetical protein